MLGTIDCKSVCIPCAAAQSQARADVRFHTGAACIAAHTGSFQQTVVVYSACSDAVGTSIAAAMEGALNAGVVPNVLSADVTYVAGHCTGGTVAARPAAAAAVGAAGKGKRVLGRKPSSHTPVSAGGLRSYAHPRSVASGAGRRLLGTTPVSGRAPGAGVCRTCLPSLAGQVRPGLAHPPPSGPARLPAQSPWHSRHHRL